MPDVKLQIPEHLNKDSHRPHWCCSWLNCVGVLDKPGFRYDPAAQKRETASASASGRECDTKLQAKGMNKTDCKRGCERTTSGNCKSVQTLGVLADKLNCQIEDLERRHPAAEAFEVDQDLIYSSPQVNGEAEAEALMKELTDTWRTDQEHKMSSGHTQSKQRQMVHDVSDSDDFRKAVASAAYKLMMSEARCAPALSAIWVTCYVLCPESFL